MPDPMTPDPREAKLPAWARDRFDDLRRAVREANRERDEAIVSTKPGESDAVIDVGLGNARRLAGVNSYRGQVKYLLSGPGEIDGRYIDVYIVDEHGDRRLAIRASEGIAISPRAANSIEARVTDR